MEQDFESGGGDLWEMNGTGATPTAWDAASGVGGAFGDVGSMLYHSTLGAWDWMNDDVGMWDHYAQADGALDRAGNNMETAVSYVKSLFF